MTKSKSIVAAALGLALVSSFAGAASAQTYQWSSDRAQQRANDLKEATSDSGLAAYRYSQSQTPNYSQRDQQFIGRYNR